jgi:hypothetical protein
MKSSIFLLELLFAIAQAVTTPTSGLTKPAASKPVAENDKKLWDKVVARKNTDPDFANELFLRQKLSKWIRDGTQSEKLVVDTTKELKEVKKRLPDKKKAGKMTNYQQRERRKEKTKALEAAEIMASLAVSSGKTVNPTSEERSP